MLLNILLEVGSSKLVTLVLNEPLSVFKFVTLVENEELGATKAPEISDAI